MEFLLIIVDADGKISEEITFSSDAEAEGYWELISESYPEDWDYYIVWECDNLYGEW